MLIAPPDFRTRLPARVNESGRIFRDIQGLEEIYDTKGSGAAPEMLRGEMGTLWVHDLQRTLARQLVTQDAVNVDVVVAGASASATTAFSFPTDHALVAMFFEGVTNPANIAAMRLNMQPFGDPVATTLGYALGADFEVLPLITGALAVPKGPVLPFFGKATTDYILEASTNAGGGGTVRLKILVNQAPIGVEIVK